MNLKPGNESSEYSLTKWSNIIGGLLVALSGLGWFTVEEARTITPVIAAAVVIGLAILNSVYTNGRSKVKAEAIQLPPRQPIKNIVNYPVQEVGVRTEHATIPGGDNVVAEE